MFEKLYPLTLLKQRIEVVEQNALIYIGAFILDIFDEIGYILMLVFLSDIGLISNIDMGSGQPYL